MIDGSTTFLIHACHGGRIAKALPDGRRRALEGHAHNVDHNVLAPVLKEFFRTAQVFGFGRVLIREELDNSPLREEWDGRTVRSLCDLFEIGLT